MADGACVLSSSSRQILFFRLGADRTIAELTEMIQQLPISRETESPSRPRSCLIREEYMHYLEVNELILLVLTPSDKALHGPLYLSSLRKSLTSLCKGSDLGIAFLQKRSADVWQALNTVFIPPPPLLSQGASNDWESLQAQKMDNSESSLKLPSFQSPPEIDPDSSQTRASDPMTHLIAHSLEEEGDINRMFGSSFLPPNPSSSGFGNGPLHQPGIGLLMEGIGPVGLGGNSTLLLSSPRKERDHLVGEKEDEKHRGRTEDKKKRSHLKKGFWKSVTGAQ